MEALASLGALAAMPDITLKVGVGNDAQCTCCVGKGAVVNNTRVVFESKANVLKEEKPGLLERLFGCCCGKKKKEGSTEENKRAIEMFQLFLEQQCGHSSAEAAPLLAEVDLQSRHDQGKPLRAKHVGRITLAVRTMQEREPAVLTSLSELQWMGEEQREKSEDVDPFAGIEDFTPYVREVLDVQVTDDTNNSFTDPTSNNFSGRAVNAWVRENVLCSYSLDWDKTRANEFISRVKYAIKMIGETSFTTAEVKKIVYRQLKVMGIKVTAPSFMERISDSTIRESIRTKAQRGPDISNLTAEELTALFRAVQTQTRV